MNEYEVQADRPMKKSRNITYCLSAFVLVTGAAFAQVTLDTPGYFPFTMSPLDVSESFTDMSFLNPTEAGASGQIKARGSHFVDGNGKRVRFLGTNLTFQGAFPDKKDASLIAGHLRKYGFNVIRFHHIDGSQTPRGLWLPGQEAFDPEQLDKLDWLIYQLKLHGIYTNLNLHVSRHYPGLPRDIARPFRYGKGLDNFHQPFIDMQREYARMLLTHKNPYTQTTYAQEPAVAFVEINNENSLTNIKIDDFVLMPEAILNDFSRQWNAWLVARYKTTDKLRAKWNAKSEALGKELITNGSFKDQFKAWAPQQSNGASMRATVINDPAITRGKAAKLVMESTGNVSWSLQVHQNGLNLKPNQRYTLRFKAKAGKPRTLNVTVRLDQDPWSMCGLNPSVKLGTKWQDYEFVFKAVNTKPGHVRTSFNFMNQLGTFYLADVSLRQGGEVGLRAGQSLEAGNIPIPAGRADETQIEDFISFLQSTEHRYFAGIIKFLKKELVVKALISGTQASYGGILGIHREGTLSDYIDMHGYWEHPRFPGKPWDRSNWFIPNTSMVTSKTGGVPGSRAWMRVMGKPFTVSEYDHPAPNDYAAEMFPMYASFAAFQDWDGIYSFSYLNKPIEPGQSLIRGYFEQCNHPAKMAFLPVAAVMFRMEAVKAGTNPTVADLQTDDLPLQVARQGKNLEQARDFPAAAILSPVGVRLTKGSGWLKAPKVDVPQGERTANTGQIKWRTEKPARYTVNAPAVRAAVGYIGGETISLGDVTIHVKKAENNWAAIAVCALDGKPIKTSKRILVVVAGRAENANMGWNKERNSVGAAWGASPTMAEAIQATIHIPGKAQIAALDGHGKITTNLQTTVSGKTTSFDTNAGHKTIWYSVSR